MQMRAAWSQECFETAIGGCFLVHGGKDEVVMAKIIDGKEISRQIKDELREQVKSLKEKA